MSTPEKPPGGVPAGTEENRKLSGIVSLIHELTGRGIRSESSAELFRGAFDALFHCVPFDVAVAVMIEQHLELYISTRRKAEALIGDSLATRLRATLESVIPVSFATTDLVVRAEWHDLDERDAAVPGDDLDVLHAVIERDGRVAGVLVVNRYEPFDDHERHIFEIFNTQMSLLVANLSSRERILSLADTDDLTGIWNKRFFRRHLPQEIERARVYSVPVSLLMFDVDAFKEINDSLGHTVGDVVLSELCGAVRETLRPPDFFARFGGDEFAVVLPHTDLIGARAAAERILEKVRELAIPTDEEAEVRCSISIGVASFRDGEGAADLVRRADELLYEAKRQGKNRIVAG